MWLTGSRAQAQELWCMGLVVTWHVGSSQIRARTHVSLRAQKMQESPMHLSVVSCLKLRQKMSKCHKTSKLWNSRGPPFHVLPLPFHAGPSNPPVSASVLTFFPYVISFTSSRTSYKCNNTVSTFLCLAYLAQYKVFEIHPCYSK